MPLKFGIVREDPIYEVELCARAEAALLVCSGGCTALTLAHQFPRLRVTVFDINPLQLQHLENKRRARDFATLQTLNQAGEFEALFRLMQKSIEELVAPPDELAAYFSRARSAHPWLASRYWPAVFSTTFNDPLLHAMFGLAATQHAEPGSYPSYFQRAFERGLLRDDGPDNPFLQHVLLGRHLAPPSWCAAEIPPIEIVEGSLPEVARLERFDLFSLSNVFDWSDDALAADWGGRIGRAARPGATVLIRQLNNRRSVARFFPGFHFEPADAGRDRSLFYERILIGKKS